MADASRSFFSKNQRHNDITANVKDRVCVGELPSFYQRPYYLSIYRFTHSFSIDRLKQVFFPMNGRALGSLLSTTNVAIEAIPHIRADLDHSCSG